MILINTTDDGATAALLHFLNNALQFQEMYSTVIATDDSDEDFF